MGKGSRLDFGDVASLVAALALVVLPPAALAATAEQPSYGVVRSLSPINCDGELEEAPWQSSPTFRLGFESYPADNTPATYETKVWITFDDEYLYAAFRSFDPDPASIRARFSERDSAYTDDLVGIAIDPFNDGRRAFKFYSNALGVQTDFVVDEVSRANDYSWDVSWKAAARITATGYDVEMAIPFSALRFPGAAGQQEWGVDAIRLRPRIDFKRFSLVPLPRGETCLSFCNPAHLTGIEGGRSGLSLELAPTVSTIRTDQRGSGESWNKGSFETEAGLSVSWRPSPSWTLNLAGNPDFSQVEADAIQLEVNRQFSLFYPEQRPFFVEGADYFKTPIRLFHSRDIADPSVGAKVTGRQGRSTFAAVIAEDEVTNFLVPGSEGSRTVSLDRTSKNAYARYRLAVGERSTLGVAYSNRGSMGYDNEVGSLDGIVRWNDVDSLTVQFAATATNGEASFASSQDWAPGVSLGYLHDARSWRVSADYLSLDEDFRADLGFVPKVDLERSQIAVSRLWYPVDSGLYEVTVSGGAIHEETRSGKPLEQSFSLSVNTVGDSDAVVSAACVVGAKHFQGREYPIDGIALHGERRFSDAWFASLDTGYAKDFDFAGDRLAKRLQVSPAIEASLGLHFLGRLGLIYEDSRAEKENVYEARAVELRARWRFNNSAYIRAVVQGLDIVEGDPAVPERETRERTVASQWLVAYEWRPETVFYLGYSDRLIGSEAVTLSRIERTLFVKVGYALDF